MGNSIRPWIAKIAGFPVRTRCGDADYHRRLLAQAVNEVGRHALTPETTMTRLESNSDVDGTSNLGVANRKTIISGETVVPVPSTIHYCFTGNIANLADPVGGFICEIHLNGSRVALSRVHPSGGKSFGAFSIAMQWLKGDVEPGTALSWSVESWVQDALDDWRFYGERCHMTVRVEPQLPEVS